VIPVVDIKPEVPSPPGHEGPDAFVTKLNPTGSALLYSTYLGGGFADRAYGLAADGAGSVYVTGSTDSSTTSGSCSERASTSLRTRTTRSSTSVSRAAATSPSPPTSPGSRSSSSKRSEWLGVSP
jgi:hypothetical protein